MAEYFFVIPSFSFRNVLSLLCVSVQHIGKNFHIFFMIFNFVCDTPSFSYLCILVLLIHTYSI